MTTPTTKPSREGLAAQAALLGRGADWYPRLAENELAAIIDRETNLPALLRIKEAARKVLNEPEHDRDGLRTEHINAMGQLRAALSEAE